MKVKASAITTAALLALGAQASGAAEVVGYNVIAVPANSDVIASVPFNKDVELSTSVESVTANGVTVANTLEPDAYADGYYIRFIDGNGEGLWSTITANGTGGFELENTDVLDYVQAGDAFRVYAHHTIGTLFPAGMYGVSYTNMTQVLVYENDLSAMTVNKAAKSTALYTGSAWVGSANGSTVLKPETQFILRNSSASALSYIAAGDVPDYSVSMLVAAGGDVVIGSGYPVPVKLDGSGLEGVMRQVLFFDNALASKNKAAANTALYTGSTWVGSGAASSIAPASAVALRLSATESETKLTINKPY